MPFYEYRCGDCNSVSTELVPLSERDIDQVCPVCMGTATRIMSATKTTFKEADKSGIKQAR